MRIEQLRSFLAVYETNSFSAAANQLYVSQPAITKQMMHLEEELGSPLFERTTRRVIPTKTGELLYEKAGSGLRLIDEAIAECKALAHQRNRISIGYEYLFMDRHSMPWLKEFRQQHGESIELDVIEHSSPQLFTELSEGSLDCAFLGLTKPELVPAFLEKRTIAFVDEVIVVAKDHPLASREYVCVDDLINEEFVYPLTKPTFRESIVICDFEERGKAVRSSIALHQPSALRMVEQNGMVINLPAAFEVEGASLVRIPYKSENRITYYFIWNRSNKNEAFGQFHAFVEKKIAESGF